MSFWRDHMPADMFLRSGPDWHLDAGGEHTFEAFFEDRGLRPEDVRPDPDRRSSSTTPTGSAAARASTSTSAWSPTCPRPDGGFVATMDDGSTITAEKVLAAPGIRHFVNLPAWHAEVPPDRRGHTSDLVSFDDLAGARVVIIGGRQSAYEWAALLCDHGAERVDVVHRHAVPDFAKVSWAFVDAYVDQTLAQRGWWRRLPGGASSRRSPASSGRSAGSPSSPGSSRACDPDVVTRAPGAPRSPTWRPVTRDVTLTLSDGTALTADHVVFASGYRADLARVPYLAGVLDRVSITDGFPDLTEGFETSLPGLYVTGFASTRDFGPFYGFTKGCPSSARIAVDEMMTDESLPGRRPARPCWSAPPAPRSGSSAARSPACPRSTSAAWRWPERSPGSTPRSPSTTCSWATSCRPAAGRTRPGSPGSAAASRPRCRPRPSTTSVSPR